MPQIDLKARDFYKQYITPHPETGNIVASEVDLAIFSVELLLDVRDILLDMHGMMRAFFGGRPVGPASKIVLPGTDGIHPR